MPAPCSTACSTTRSASGAWIDLRASLYVCGNSDQVGEIESALTEVVAEQGRMSGDEAAEYLSEMARDRRYQRSLNGSAGVVEA